MATDINGTSTRARTGAEEFDTATMLAAIVNSSDDAIIGADLNGTITSWNLGAERMYGYSALEAIGHNASLIVPPDRRDELEEILAKVARAELVQHHVTQRLCKDETVLDVSITVSPIRDATGSVIGASAIDRNITYRLNLEREQHVLEGRLRQSERLDILSQLAGGIAHDFNNLLAVILNYTNFVVEELDDQERALADLAEIHRATERASTLTRQLLTFARREVIQPKVVDLNKLFRSVEELVRGTIGEHIELVIALSGDLRCVEADPGQVERVLLNLVVNARDAMPDGGIVTIDTENVEIDEADAYTHSELSTGSYVRFRVSDTGTGMEPSVLEHVFEPFFTTKPRGEGSGLGLPTVFGIIAQAGGETQIYSELGRGTTCQVLLPSTDRLPSAAQPVVTPRDAGGQETVLVVEDEDALRDIAERILARNGYHVLTSANGAEALELVGHYDGAIDVLLTDVMMPKMLGKELTTKLRTLYPDLPVLYMSGYAQPVLGSTLGGEVSLLEKPFSDVMLLAKVRDALGRSRPATVTA